MVKLPEDVELLPDELQHFLVISASRELLQRDMPPSVHVVCAVDSRRRAAADQPDA